MKPYLYCLYAGSADNSINQHYGIHCEVVSFSSKISSVKLYTCLPGQYAVACDDIMQKNIYNDKLW